MVKFYEFVILAREAKAMLTRMGSIFLGGGSLPLSGYLAKRGRPPWLQYAATPSSDVTPCASEEFAFRTAERGDKG